FRLSLTGSSFLWENLLDNVGHLSSSSSFLLNDRFGDGNWSSLLIGGDSLLLVFRLVLRRFLRLDLLINNFAVLDRDHGSFLWHRKVLLLGGFLLNWSSLFLLILSGFFNVLLRLDLLINNFAVLDRGHSSLLW